MIFLFVLIHLFALLCYPGFSSVLGEHQIFIHPSKENIQVSSLIALVPSEEQIMETMLGGVGLRRDTNMLVLTGRPKSYDMNQMPNIWFHEVTVTPPIMTNKVDAGQIVMEVEYTQIGRKGGAFVREEFTRRLNELSAEFHKRFTERFPVDLSQFTERQANLSKISVSNLLGGLGYFYGSSLVQSSRPGSEPVSNWPAGLFTATPSRSMFPRGFLWDEGFHGLILARWDPILAMETVGHWLDLMNMDGWIPREVILGSEARSRVPPKFVVQQDNIANPPSLALVIDVRVLFNITFSLCVCTAFLSHVLHILCQTLYPNLLLFFPTGFG
ncbi:Mannosyl-oligosaccharide glucosidase [Fasciola gigantica]|uniref:mannosyl-oligosaccharide glucosidase n=1 Tax=Fasciola gigantica TaxID=46835 RepID=A0A504YSW7_FASGI|nr:Mannosyl-oligosaccharide glucosidase [Fasciola gigantica]